MTTNLPRLRARSRRLLGPWRSTGVHISSTHLVMHTLQHRAVWDDLVRDGVHRPPRWQDDHELAEAYGWMHQQMTDRLPTSSDGMLWLWAQRPRLALRAMRPKPGDVVLTCRVPREDVLVSHFDDWHCVLNRSPLVASLPTEDEDAYGRRLDPILDDFLDRRHAAGLTQAPRSDWPADMRREVESTWTGIFDPTQWFGRPVLQATVHELRAEHVVRASLLR